MNTINIAADATAQRIGIGNQYENEATAVVFDCSQFAEDHGAGTAQIIHRRPTESIGYVCTNVSQTNNTVTWLVTDDDTSFTGKGQVQLRWYVNDVLRESVIFPTYILPSVTSSGDAPEDVKSAVEKLMEYIQDNTISTEDLDERIANYFYDHPLPMEGEADGLVAGSAKQLLSESYTLDQVPYLYRKSPDSDRAVEEIVGGTVGWNQLAVLPATGTKSGITVTNNGDGSLTIDGTATEFTNSFAIGSTWTSGHVYYFGGIPNDIKLYTQLYQDSTWVKNLNLSEQPRIRKLTDTVTANRMMASQYILSNTTFDKVKYWPQIFDLTTMFGTTIADYIYSLETATAGAGVAKLKEWGFFTEDYYEYCEPTLKSVEGLVRKKTVGFNQWDEEWENGYYNNVGVFFPNNSYVASKNKIPVLPSTEYNFHSGSKNGGRVCFYDAEETFVYTETGFGSVENWIFTTPANAFFMTFDMTGNYGATYKSDICINLSDPTRNGQYEPYESHSYSLDSSVVLRGVPKLDSNNNLYFDGDIYPADGQGKRRYGLVDLGDLTFSDNGATSSAQQFVTFGIPKANGETNFICQDFIVTMAGHVGTVAGRASTKAVVFCVAPGTSLADFSASVAGKKLLYELATPTTFTAQPYHNPQIVGDTEEFVTTGIVPVGHATRYYQNLRKKIEGLPWNFSSLIAPTEVSNEATRNYTTGSYLILNNVLYKVTANIANGGTINVNTNVTETTIMAEIMSL